MKKTILSSLFLLSVITVNAQDFEWAKSMGDSGSDVGHSITTDAAGNVYTTGSFEGTVDFDPGSGVFNLSSAGISDIFIQKLDAAGNFLWAKSIGGSGWDEAKSITTDAAGNVYTTGRFSWTVDFDPGAGTFNVTSAGSSDIFIQKLDGSGNFLWAKSIGGSGWDGAKSITTDAAGNVYTTGEFSVIVDFDPGSGSVNLTSAGSKDIFIQKLDAAGNFLWAKSMGGSANDYGNSITTDAAGNVYTTGSFVGTVDFDPGAGTFNLSPAGSDDIFIQKLDGSGNFLWAKRIAGSGNDYGLSITTNAAGNVYTTGWFEGTVNFDPGSGVFNLSSAGGSDIFIQKLDGSGNFLWAKSMGGSTNDYGRSITMDAAGNIYTTGWFRENADFDPGSGIVNLSSAGSDDDIFIQKLDGDGNFIWAKSMGGSGNDYGLSITTDAAGNAYTTGWFRETVDFDPGSGIVNLSSAGSVDIFVQKLGACSNTTSTDVQTACGSYTWIDGNTYTASNTTATHTLTNAAGCDSVVTLNLTINTVDVSVTQTDDVTIEANASGLSYQWLDCNDNNAIISGETNQSMTATVNGNYAVEITENGCVDTSACTVISSVGIEENAFGNSFTVSPNPTNGSISLDLGDVYPHLEVVVYDFMGRVVSSDSFADTKHVSLELEGATGVYLLDVSSADKHVRIPVLKK